MKYTKEYLRSRKIFNSHDICRLGGVKLFISYCGIVSGRAYRSAQWQVCGMGFKTDPISHWADYGNKTFTVKCREEKEGKLDEAMLFCKEKYGITKWEKDVWGDYQIEGVIQKAIAAATGK